MGSRSPPPQLESGARRAAEPEDTPGNASRIFLGFALVQAVLYQAFQLDLVQKAKKMAVWRSGAASKCLSSSWETF